ncbi:MULTISPECIES: response regulator transcription factor [Kocuria]|uniref:response regulator transcription factor n=1 Tax=Kocuria TaxID=57493 RepID=UPI00204134A7|nr:MULTISPECIES: response regulator transcription factor [Kocuria]MCM3687722.1 response regulator transcription factor [Kocuria rosea]HST71030.1 response regulator transcription factor [Kocuria rosea]
MFQILMLTDADGPSASVLPALDLLNHKVAVAPTRTASGSLDGHEPDVVVLDGRTDLITARNLAQLLTAKGLAAPLLMVLTEGGMAAVAANWMVDDVVLDTAGPAEVEARLRLASSRTAEEPEDDTRIRVGSVVIDDAAYSAHVNGHPLNLTYKEFELLKFLAQHAGRVFTRAQLLSEVWGYDYYGGTRTVDVHVRRLRAKLGADHEHLITTVRNVGYSFTTGRGRED